MTLLITMFAALYFSVRWYRELPDVSMRYNTAALIFWGATLMWAVDAVYEYLELKSSYFSPSPSDMLNDAFLGLCVVAIGITIWFVMLVIKNPRHERK